MQAKSGYNVDQQFSQLNGTTPLALDMPPGSLDAQEDTRMRHNAAILQPSPDSANSLELRKAALEDIATLANLLVETFEAIYATKQRYVTSPVSDEDAISFIRAMMEYVPVMYPLLELMDGENVDFRKALQRLAPVAHAQIALQSDVARAVKSGNKDVVAPEAYRAYLKEMPYNEYLQTPHWRDVRQNARLRAQYRCQVCNTSDGSLHVHHRTYENRGNEQPDDVILLCATCHELFHTHGKLAS